MKRDKALRRLLLPLIFLVLLFIPAIIEEIVPESIWSYFFYNVRVIYVPYVDVLCVSAVIWYMLFAHIPIGIYIAMLVVYTVVSWRWILRRKKGNAKFFLLWIILCALALFLHWKFGDLYYAMMWI